MKAVFLLAGIGRRLGDLTEKKNKSLIPLHGTPLLKHLIDRFVAIGIHKIVAVVGHDKESVISHLNNMFKNKVDLEIAENNIFSETNNMYSIFRARGFLDGSNFILCNGDMVINRDIIKKLINLENMSAIAVDDFRKHERIDSPKTTVENGIITDLGRHIPIENNYGYAIGLYRFNRELSTAYFMRIEEMLAQGKINAGFHEPLMDLFKVYSVYPMSTDGRSWGDIDVPEDIAVIEQVLTAIQEEESV